MTLSIRAAPAGEGRVPAGNPRSNGLELLPAIDFQRDALLFDVDGTLLDIAPTPDEVEVPADLKEALACLVTKTNGAVALVSGRRLAALDDLFAPLRLAAIGCHGAELRPGPERPAMERVAALSREVRDAFSDIGILEPRLRVEDKIFSLAFHFRQAPETERKILALIAERAARFAPKLMVLHGKAVVEVKSSAIDKGEAVTELIQQPRFAGRRPIFLGDDETDEDVFSLLNRSNGIGISVGRQTPRAPFVIPGPAEVRQWLASLAKQETP